jgi:hypothetical protein
MADLYDDPLDEQNDSPVEQAPAPVRPVAPAPSPFTRGRGNRAPVGRMVAGMSQAEQFVQQQEVAQQRADVAAERANRQQRMAALEDQFIRKGLDYYKGEDGMLRPKRDESGAVLYKEGDWAKAKLPDGGWGYQRRGKTGKPETKRASIVTGGESDPNLYYDFGNDGREVAGHVDDLVGAKDPEVALEAQKHRSKWASAQRKAAMRPLDDQLTALEQERNAAEVQRADLIKQQEGNAARRADLEAKAEALKSSGKWTKGWLSKELTSEAAPIHAQLEQIQAQDTDLLTKQDQLLAPWKKSETETGAKALQLSALNAEREAWEAESKLSAYNDVAEERRAVLRKLGRSEADDPILKEIAKVQEQFGARTKQAREKADVAKNPFSPQTLDVGSVYLGGSPEEREAARAKAAAEQDAKVAQEGEAFMREFEKGGVVSNRWGINANYGGDTFADAGIRLGESLKAAGDKILNPTADTVGGAAIKGAGAFMGGLSAIVREMLNVARGNSQADVERMAKYDQWRQLIGDNTGADAVRAVKLSREYGDMLKAGENLVEPAADGPGANVASQTLPQLQRAINELRSGGGAALEAGGGQFLDSFWSLLNVVNLVPGVDYNYAMSRAGIDPKNPEQLAQFNALRGEFGRLIHEKYPKSALAGQVAASLGQFMLTRKAGGMAAGAAARATGAARLGSFGAEVGYGLMGAQQSFTESPNSTDFISRAADIFAKGAVLGVTEKAGDKVGAKLSAVAGVAPTAAGVATRQAGALVGQTIGETSSDVMQAAWDNEDYSKQAMESFAGNAGAVLAMQLLGLRGGLRTERTYRATVDATDTVRSELATRALDVSGFLGSEAYKGVSDFFPKGKVEAIVNLAKETAALTNEHGGDFNRALENASQIYGKTAAVGELVQRAQNRINATIDTAAQIKAIPDYVPPVPAGTDPALVVDEAAKVKSANRDAASALAKIANGLPPTSLTEGEQQGLALVGESLGSSMVDFSAGRPIITDKARTWLSDLAPASAGVLDRSETQQREVLAAQAKAAMASASQPPADVPGAQAVPGTVAPSAAPAPSSQSDNAGTTGLQLKLSEADLSGPVQAARVLRAMGRSDSSARSMSPKSKTLVARVTAARVNRLAKVFQPIFGQVVVTDDAVGSGGFTAKGGNLHVHLGDLAHFSNEEILSSDARLASVFTEEAAHVVSLKLEADGQWNAAEAWAKLTPEEQQLFSAAYLRDQQGKPRAANEGDLAFRLGHETVRMFVQGRARFSQDGKVIVDGKTTEQTASRGLLAMLRDILSKIQALLTGEGRGSQGAQELRAVADRIGGIMEQLVGVENFAYGDSRTTSAAAASVQPPAAPHNSRQEQAAPAAAETPSGQSRPAETTTATDEVQNQGQKAQGQEGLLSPSPAPAAAQSVAAGVPTLAPAKPNAGQAVSAQAGNVQESPTLELGSAADGETGPRAAMQVAGDALTPESRVALAAELGIAPEQIGAVEKVTHKGRVMHVVNVLADAQAFPTSHNPDGSVRRDYPQDLQPRDRSGDIYLAQQRQMAASPNLNEEALKGTTDRGVPIVALVEGVPVVVMGNGRANAKRLMYESSELVPVAQKFAQDLAPIAAEKGIASGAMGAVERPTLYRVALDAMPVDALREASQESNEFAGAATNAVEQARQDAGRMSPNVLAFLVAGFDLAAGRNTPFRSEFVRSVIGSSAANITEGDLVRRIEAALFAKAYSGSPEGAQAFSRLLNDDDAGVKALIGAMMDVAPKIAALNTGIEEGSLHPLRISDDIARAVEDIAVTLRDKPSSKTTATALDGLLNQGEMAGITERTPLQEAVLRFLVENRNNKGRIVGALRSYIQLVRAEGDPKQASMFGDVAVRSTEELWRDSVALSANEVLASTRSRVAGRLDNAIELASGASGWGSDVVRKIVREDKARDAEERRAAMAPAVEESRRIMAELEQFKKANADRPYVVVDTRTGAVVYRTTYKFKGRARGDAEKRNREWGAFRYTARFEDQALASGRSRRADENTGDLFAAMGLAEDAKLYGETVPLAAKETPAAFVKQAAQDIPAVRGDLKAAKALGEIAAPDLFLTAADEGQDAPDVEATDGQASPEGQQSDSEEGAELDEVTFAQERAAEIENDPNADEASVVSDVEPLDQDAIRAHEATFGPDSTLAPEKFFEKYRPAAERMAAVKFANIPGTTVAERMQQARLLLWEAVSGVSAATQQTGNKKFADYGVGKQGTARTFWQYFGNLARRRLATMFVQNVRRVSREVSTNAGSISSDGDVGESDSEGGGGTIEDYLESGDDVASTAERDDSLEKAREALSSAMSILSDREVRALRAMMASDRGGVLKAVQEATGVNSVQHAKLILDKAQQRLKQILDSRGFNLADIGLASGRSGLPPPPDFALRNTDPAGWKKAAAEWAEQVPDVVAFRATGGVGADALFTSRNTREGEGPWRVTFLRKWNEGMRPINHTAFPSRAEAFKYALIFGEPDEGLLMSMPADVRRPEGRELWNEQLTQLFSGSGGEGGPFAKLAPKTIPVAPGSASERVAEKWLEVMPAFQGGKYQMARPAAEAIARTFTKEQREKIDTVFDYFGGGGMWGGYLALTHFPNAKRLVVHELDPLRAAKIELYHRQGDRIVDLLDSVEGKALFQAVTEAASSDEATSGTAVAARMRALSAEYQANPDMRGVIGALTDAAMNARGRAKDQSGTKTAEASVEKIRSIAIRDAADAFKGAEALRQRGVAFELRQGDSYAGEVAQGDNVLAVMDPPYYLTTGYDGKIVPLGIYQKTSDMIGRLSKAGNAIIYTDSAWWIDHPEQLAATGGLFTGGLSEDQAALGPVGDLARLLLTSATSAEGRVECVLDEHSI